MKKNPLLFISVMAIFLLAIFSTNLYSQKIWEKYSENPVLVDGEIGDWDNHSVFLPRLIYHNNTYKMYYTGRENDKYQIGFATLDGNGVTWTKHPNNPIIPLGTEGAWDQNREVNQLLIVNDTMHLYYTCWTPGQENYSIGHGISTDGINWCLCDGPVLQKGAPGAWDDDYVFGASVIHTGNMFHMWYSGSGDDEKVEIGYAWSYDGVDWTRYSMNPVLELGNDGSFYDERTYYPYVIYDDNKFKMWFNGYDGYYLKIGYAESLNRVEWTVFQHPVVYPGAWNSWEQEDPHGPCVIKDGDTYKMLYAGNEWSCWRIGYAEGLEVLDVPGDYGTIQEGIDAINEDEILLVDEGTYYECIDFKGKPITIASNFALNQDTNFINTTIIDGSQSREGDRGSVVYFVSGEDTKSTLKGFTIRGGSGTPSSWDNGLCGAGIFIEQSGATIEYNKIVYNSLNANGKYSFGAGIFADTCSYSTVFIRNNLISGNTITSDNSDNKYVTGAGISVGCNSMITGNTITNNIIQHNAYGQVLGAGIDAYSSRTFIKDNIIAGNIAISNTYSFNPWGGGLFLEDIEAGSLIMGNTITNNIITAQKAYGGGIGMYNNVGKVVFDKNLIMDNEAQYGGGVSLGLNDEALLTNNVINENHAFYGGAGLYMKDSKSGTTFNTDVTGRSSIASADSHPGGKIYPILVNNTIVENYADKYGGGLFTSKLDDDFIAFNNIFYGNSAYSGGNEMYLGSSGYMYNNVFDEDEIEGNVWVGKANINIDPLLRDDNIHLEWESYCANAGTKSIEINGIWYASPATDYDGDVRPYLSTEPDIGADEAPIMFVDVEEAEETESMSWKVYPNPFSTSATIEYELNQPEQVTVEFYNHLGEMVYRNTEYQNPGLQKITWTPELLTNGIYYFNIQVHGTKVSGKLVLMK